MPKKEVKFLAPNDWPGGTSAALVLFVRTKSTQKGAGGAPQTSQNSGGFSDTLPDEELRCPVNQPHLLALHTKLNAHPTAARLDKMALSAGRSHRTGVPQQGPPIGPVGRRRNPADEEQAPSGESNQLQQRANKQNIRDSQGALPLERPFGYFSGEGKVTRHPGARGWNPRKRGECPKHPP